MSEERKYYCLCEANCKFETMTKEQILAAIAQAAETGLVVDPDAGFISKVKEANEGKYVTFWVGTQAQYNALSSVEANCLYIITDDTTKEDFEKFAANIQQTAEAAAETAQAADANCAAALETAEEANANANAAVATANAAATEAAAAVATADAATETANIAATSAAEAVETANEALDNAGIKREFNVKASSSTGDLELSYSKNAAWFYIVEVMDSTGTSSVYSRETMALDYYSLISENTYEFACGAKICGYLSGKKVTVMITNENDTKFRLSRFTGYL